MDSHSLDNLWWLEVNHLSPLNEISMEKGTGGYFPYSLVHPALDPHTAKALKRQEQRGKQIHHVIHMIINESQIPASTCPPTNKCSLHFSLDPQVGC